MPPVASAETKIRSGGVGRHAESGMTMMWLHPSWRSADTIRHTSNGM